MKGEEEKIIILTYHLLQQNFRLSFKSVENKGAAA
jgi:hypothetical protein